MTIHFAPQAEADFAAVIGYLAERNQSRLEAELAEPHERVAVVVLGPPSQGTDVLRLPIAWERWSIVELWAPAGEDTTRRPGSTRRL